ncbi:DUF3147 family protein [Macrococcoides caseolyticum]|uniref:DUF3147 family protein n=1 Tax=Macrococcoides caseolyticum TaxID=69966 RepID=UPI000C34E4A8|nr:DUF3147 family protein [Macrococcus caseolyticus]MDJ1089155.1 DUF3147 family protein [Macrococcus caseolyticus]MDJ1091638.1 DUF3147 family protein [Macrococcus caseolyticus]MDJ1153294.1 DUF3147 family protein [Macrococcus caseolyticus]MDJ1156579.1 DUF3147 family protein [Macrococcus caseolyticus]MEB8170261.1 DUF3147 family protein [Macrococcus caseolyticus]
MKTKILLLKFLIGGSTVAFSYIISKVIPWEDFGGIFATFPAVFLLSLVIAGMEYGNTFATNVCRGAVFGMTGGLISILVTWSMLSTTSNYALSIVTGFIAWFVSALIISKVVSIIHHAVTHKSLKHSSIHAK